MEPNHHPLQAIVPTFEPFTVRSVGIIEEDLEINSSFDAVHVLGVCMKWPSMWRISNDDRDRLLELLTAVTCRTDRRLEKRYGKAD